MQTNSLRFEASELCSRKLRQLITDNDGSINARQRQQVLSELCARNYHHTCHQNQDKTRRT